VLRVSHLWKVFKVRSGSCRAHRGPGRGGRRLLRATEIVYRRSTAPDTTSSPDGSSTGTVATV